MSSIINTSRIAIVGLGQLGASLAMRLSAIGTRELFGVARREEVLLQALDMKIIDAGSTDPTEVLAVVDITFLCMPVEASIEFTRTHIDAFRFGSIVTDIGSVKGEVVRELRPMLLEKGVYFIGGHPMAGTERSGIDSATADLYDGCTVFLTPTTDDETDAIDLVRDFWIGLGAHPIEIGCDDHDRAVAVSSHLLHLASAAICHTVLAGDDSDARRIACAGAFRDMSRISGGSETMWTEICRTNQAAVIDGLEMFSEQLSRIQALVKNGDWDELSAFLGTARELHASWIGQ